MSELIVFTYPTEDQAAAALGQVVTQKQENVQAPLVDIEDAAVAVKTRGGKVKVRQTLESAAKGSQLASGGLWGLLIGFLFGGPLFGALLGLGVSKLLGRNLDLGIDNEFIDGVSRELQPGNSALFLLVEGTAPEIIAEALGDHRGKLHHTSMSDEAAAALAEASTDSDLAAAAEAEQAEDD